MIINKFGGEIMGDPALVKLAVKHIKNQLKAGQKPVVVVSALKGVTDRLVDLCGKYDKQKIDELERMHEEWCQKLKTQNSTLQACRVKTITQNLKLKLDRDSQMVKRVKNKAAVKDRILAVGEKWAFLLFAELLRQNGVNAGRFTGEELGIITDDNFGDANVDYEASIQNIRTRIVKIQNSKFNPASLQGQNYNSKLKSIYIVPVITGFVGRTVKGQTTTLGRGGSDTTACLAGAALKAEKVILWKNVAGVLSADPKIVKPVKIVKFLDYEEAEESGKVIHDKAMRLVRRAAVKVEVAYIQNSRQKTVITQQGSKASGVKIISSKDNLRLLIMTGDKVKHAGALLEIANIISGQAVNMVLIRNTRDNLYVVVDKNHHNINNIEGEIKKSGYQLEVQDAAMINVIGKLDWDTVERFNHLLHIHYPQAYLGAFPYRNCVRLEAVVPPRQVVQLVMTLHKEFIKC